MNYTKENPYRTAAGHIWHSIGVGMGGLSSGSLERGILGYLKDPDDLLKPLCRLTILNTAYPNRSWITSSGEILFGSKEELQAESEKDWNDGSVTVRSNYAPGSSEVVILIAPYTTNTIEECLDRFDFNAWQQAKASYDSV